MQDQLIAEQKEKMNPMKNLSALFTKNQIGKIFFLAVTFIFSANLNAANYYWVSSTAANWNDISKWSATSGGNGGAGIPSAADVAIFDNHSTGACTVSSDINVRGIKMLSTFNSTLALLNGPNVYIGDFGFTQNHGTFIGEYGYMEVGGRFTLTGGIFNAPQSDLDIVGTYSSSDTVFKYTAGTFLHHNANLVFYIETLCNAVSLYVDVPAANNFYDVTFEVMNTCNSTIDSKLIVTGNDTLNVADNLHWNDGMLSGKVSVAGNLYLQNCSQGGDSKIIMKGSSTQYYSKATNNSRMDELVINKPTGSVLPSFASNNFSVGSFSLLSGTFFAPTDTFFIGGLHAQSETILNQSGGIYDHNHGTIVLDASASVVGLNFGISTHNIKCINKVAIRNFQNPFPSSFNMMNSDTLFSEGDLSLESGVCNNGVFETEGNVTVENLWKGGNTKLLFSGKNPQLLDASSNISGYEGSMVINKLDGDVTLVSPVEIFASSQSIEFIKGNIISSVATLLTFGNNANAIGANDSSFVNGPVSKIGNAMFEFPVGANGNIFAPLMIDASTDPSNEFVVEYFPDSVSSNFPTTILTPSVIQVSGNEYWSFVHAQGNIGVRVSLSWNISRSDSALINSQAVVSSWNGTAWQGEGNSSAISFAPSGYLQSFSQINNSSPLTFASGVPLSTENISSQFSVNVYPNPTAENLHIDFASEDMNVQIVDTQGKTVMSEEFKGGSADVNVSALENGNYFLVMRGGKGVETKMFVVEK